MNPNLGLPHPAALLGTWRRLSCVLEPSEPLPVTGAMSIQAHGKCAVGGATSVNKGGWWFGSAFGSQATARTNTNRMSKPSYGFEIDWTAMVLVHNQDIYSGYNRDIAINGSTTNAFTKWFN